MVTSLLASKARSKGEAEVLHKSRSLQTPAGASGSLPRERALACGSRERERVREREGEKPSMWRI